MNYETYGRIKKGNIKTLREFQVAELPWAWFVCVSITENTASAAQMLRLAWKETIEAIVDAADIDGSFEAVFTEELFKLSENMPESDEMFSSLPIPRLPKRFDYYMQGIMSLTQRERSLYLLNRFGELSHSFLSQALDLSTDKAKEYMRILEKKTIPDESGKPFAEAVRLSTEFRRANERLFEQIAIPEIIITAIEHDYNSIYNRTRKEPRKMAGQSKIQNTAAKPTAQNRKAAEKRKKTIIISVMAAISAVAVLVAVVFAVQGRSIATSSIMTTYNIDEVTYGNVSTTISGSGSLTPLTKETLTIADCIKEESESDTATDDESTSSDVVAQSTDITDGSEFPSMTEMPALTVTVSDIQVSVGDTVAEGDSIATLTFEDETTAELIAPYDAVLLEFYLHEGDEVGMTDSVAMFMGTDGYYMSISVDETNISTVKLGQEVDITIDAVSTDSELVGSVTDISYNGSASGSVTSYKIIVTFDYVEGTYPGMSVSAEIVIEDSGDGLLVPVDAVYTSGDTKYVYLAPSGAVLGDEYEQNELDVSDLTKITVETGMSDGSYMIVESSYLAEGDLIVITTVTSTLTGSENEGNSGMGGFGGGFGGMGGGGRGEFPGGGDFDFGSFDPGNMPSGGFPGFN